MMCIHAYIYVYTYMYIGYLDALQLLIDAYSVKRDLVQCQKRPSTESKET